MHLALRDELTGVLTSLSIALGDLGLILDVSGAGAKKKHLLFGVAHEL